MAWPTAHCKAIIALDLVLFYERGLDNRNMMIQMKYF